MTERKSTCGIGIIMSTRDTKVPTGPYRTRSASLQRQPSIVEPAASIVTLPELERGPSRVSRQATIHERRESETFSEKDEEAGEAGYQAEVVTFPDGGLRAWLCVLGQYC